MTRDDIEGAIASFAGEVDMSAAVCFTDEESRVVGGALNAMRRLPNTKEHQAALDSAYRKLVKAARR